MLLITYNKVAGELNKRLAHCLLQMMRRAPVLSHKSKSSYAGCAVIAYDVDDCVLVVKRKIDVNHKKTNIEDMSEILEYLLGLKKMEKSC